VLAPEFVQIKEKLKTYINKVNSMRDELETAKLETADLRMQLAAKSEAFTRLQESLNNREIAGAVVGNEGMKVEAARAKITELMREIDKCIALLNV
jgi:chromosome segregation ATPase